MYIDVQFKLKTPPSDILKRIQKRAEKSINIKTRRIKKILEEDLYRELKRAIRRSDRYHLWLILLTGAKYLYGEIGIPDITERLDTVIDVWCRDFVVDHIPFKFTDNGITGHLIIKKFLRDYSNILSLEEARYVTSTAKGALIELDWLEWLLMGGSGYIIHDYIYVSNESTTQYSRTNQGIMVHKQGKGWGFPEDLSGSSEDNFLLKILDSVIDEVMTNINNKIDKIL